MPGAPGESHRIKHEVGCLLFMALIHVLTSCGWAVAADHGPSAEPPLGNASEAESLAVGRHLLAQGRYGDAEAVARRLLARWEGTTAAPSLLTAETMDVLVEALWRGGKFADPETRRLGEQAITMKEELLGGLDAGLAPSLTNLGNVLRKCRQLEEARPYFERALAIREREFGPEDPEVAKSLNSLANLFFDMGDIETSKPLYERALRIREKTLKPDDPELAKSYFNLAIVFKRLEDLEAARRLHERALTLRKKALPPDHPDLGESYMSLGLVLYDLGSKDAGEKLCRLGLEIRRRSLGPESPDYATDLYNFANRRRTAGDYSSAESLYTQSLAIREKTLGPDHPQVARSLIARADLLKERGDHAAARPLYERALNIYQQRLPADHIDRAVVANQLGRLVYVEGDYGEARRLFETALAIYEGKHGPDHPLVAKVCDNLALAFESSGDMENAYAYARRALTIREAHPENALDLADSWSHTAYLLEFRGDYTAARPMLERALAVRRKALGNSHPEVASDLTSLAIFYDWTGDNSRARKLYRDALDIWRRTLAPDHPTLAIGLFNQANIEAELGLSRQALASALETEAVTRHHLRRTFTEQSERQALRYAVSRTRGLDLALTLVVQADPEAHRNVWDAVVRSRAIVLDEMAERRKFSRALADSATQAALENLAAASERLANLTYGGFRNDHPEPSQSLLEAARHDKETAQRVLTERIAEYRAKEEAHELGLKDVMAALPSGAVLLAYARFERHLYETKPRVGVDRTLVSSYLAFATRAGSGDVDVIDLGSAAEIDSLVAAWRREIQTAALGRGEPEDELRCRQVGQDLRSRIWDPVPASVTAARLVFVIPDGAISLVNLDALPLGASGYLCENAPLIHYMSAERDLVVTGRAAKPAHGLLAMGGVSFDAVPVSSLAARTDAPFPGARGNTTGFRGKRSKCFKAAGTLFQPLPATLHEIQEISAAWSRRDEAGVEDGAAATAAGPDTECTILTGAEASEGAFKEMAPGREILHVATHGFFLAGNCGDGGRGASSYDPRGLTITGATASQPGTFKPGDETENPLLRCGLAFTGANRPEAMDAGEDGILTAEEIAAMDLEGVAWAVLSACDTGLGEMRTGEGVMGLQRALRIAGVRTVLMSLWSVEDEATSEWMKHLYFARFGAHASTPEAVRRANLQCLEGLREKRRTTHPYLWGPFVATGDAH